DEDDDGDQIANRPGVIHGCLSPSGTRFIRVFLVISLYLQSGRLSIFPFYTFSLEKKEKDVKIL
ncbi:MAG: hypothetical protein II207_05330, partial [Clostridia bacterium]|nr:hypothetical protein [Clostridia bacterium]